MLTDPIGDLFARIKNGYLSQKNQVVVPWSKNKEALAKILVKEGFLKDLSVTKAKKNQATQMTLELRYENKKPVLVDVKRVSKPGCRRYLRAKEIVPIRSGLGISLISTSQGMMTGKEARAKNLGGEIISQVW